MRNLFRAIFGTYCGTHDVWFRSDFCEKCLRARIVREEVTDTRRIARSEGLWPINKNAAADSSDEEKEGRPRLVRVQ